MLYLVMHDLLSIAISRISVAVLSKKPYTILPYSGLILSCMQKLLDLGYITTFKVLSQSEILVSLRFVDNRPSIRRILRISKPGKRIFRRPKNMKRIFGNNIQGFWLLSTPRGVLTDQECFFYNIGGELLFTVF
uniref:Ribosomal protein S8 n=1 Tax=Balamuthia mandrillaris TaxID=66527 RepID=A0A0K1DBT3_9EUKA|nr:30S ribosomal protein S8 [Balamuthia mandrillaris]AKT93845.1 ribsomal protein S8 [Balamuthia mandrillaris]AKT94958.1 ribosomal protein S8 [Balamuthia mandrillaris]AKT94979.1 ribosomal protein S8 [Balamuthia mandrillaris]AKT95018.1 ribosomal protein S8 [Balamuthia mandrillaris]